MMDSESLSQKAIRRAVLRNSLQQPVVLYSGVVGVLAGLTGAVFHLGALSVYLAASGAATALGGWLYEYFVKKKAHSEAYLNDIHAMLNREKGRKLSQLGKNLKQMHCSDGINQLQLLDSKYRNFQDILGEKLDAAEMTYSRYLAIAEQVYLAVLDNLERVYFALKSVSTVDAEKLQQRLQNLQKDSSPYAQREYETLAKRLDLRREQLNLAETLLLENENALTEMDHITAKIAQVQISKGHADMDLQMAMDELKRLADRTADYARS
ncbi:MAG: hypothetical protein ACU837_12570 [Gammaproteobacteria bacterium]